MLTDLRIAGLALLNDCDLEIGPGLTAITGETGAGKTMLLTALRLLAGGRADPKGIKRDRARTEVDAVLTLPDSVAQQLVEAGIEIDDGEVTFSRTVTPGRSRAAISGRPVTARTLQETVGSLITIHGQADQLRLKSASHQRELLDSYLGPEHRATLDRYSRQWAEVAALRKRVQGLESDRDRMEVELRYLREVVAEVEALDPRSDEEDQLEVAIERLDNSERLRESAVGALHSLVDDGVDGSPFGSSGNASGALASALEALDRGAQLDPLVESFAQRARSLEAEVSALGADVRDYAEGLIDDPDELGRLHQRRATLTELCRGRADSAAGLLEWVEKARRRIAELEGDESDPDAMRASLEAAESGLRTLSEEVSKSRHRGARELEKRVHAELAYLALGEARLIVAIEPAPLSAHGSDRVSMLLQPHPSVDPSPLGEGASGGELSRVMLAIEVVLADTESAQTMVFDEVDAGIGGLTANHVGARLAALSRFHQVIVVTHLPQIAALADTNFVVTKSGGNATVRPVSGGERTDEIVRMLGGDDATGAARRHALELENVPSVAESKP